MGILKRGLCVAALMLAAAGAWAADYSNPILHADYSDPDAIRVGRTYYMTASSFNEAPGLPLLESHDMVHWDLVGQALPQLVPTQQFVKPQHGKGVWAPCLRYHDGKFWIFYPDPDQGIYVITATDFRGPWSAPHLVLAGKGIIDPTPLWDDDGKAWLMHGWAKSRSGINNKLTLRRMAPDASGMLDEKGTVVIDGNAIPGYFTVEGPKLYKYKGYYYVFAPAGGVENGWQSVFRSRRIEGPYEARIVMTQGSTAVNGPHQGAWVQTPEGTDWFYHFQDKRAYGRIVHLQPMRWKDGWPIIGEAGDGEIAGQPVMHHAQPVAGQFPAVQPRASDDFSAPKLGPQWQWNANWKPEWYSLTARSGFLRLYSQFQDDAQDGLWNRSAILLQRLPAEQFSVTTRLDVGAMADGDSAGLVMYGMEYAWLGVKRTQGGNRLVLVYCRAFGAPSGCKEDTLLDTALDRNDVVLRMTVGGGGGTRFSYSFDRKEFVPVGVPFTAAQGRWVGARMGLFSAAGIANTNVDTRSHVDVDDFLVTID
jgi:beta-xylosidase